MPLKKESRVFCPTFFCLYIIISDAAYWLSNVVSASLPVLFPDSNPNKSEPIRVL